MLLMDGEPRPFQLLKIVGESPMHHHGPPFGSRGRLGEAVQMLRDPAPEVARKTNVKHIPVECRQHVAARLIRDETLTTLAKGLASNHWWRKRPNFHSSMSPLADDRCSARDISLKISLMAPAFRKLALPPLAQKSE